MGGAFSSSFLNHVQRIFGGVSVGFLECRCQSCFCEDIFAVQASCSSITPSGVSLSGSEYYGTLLVIEIKVTAW